MEKGRVYGVTSYQLLDLVESKLMKTINQLKNYGKYRVAIIMYVLNLNKEKLP